MIPGTSKILSKSGLQHLLTITKMLQKIQEKIWNHLGNILSMSILDIKQFEKFLILDPPNTYFFWRNCPPPPQKISLSKRFQRIFRWWILGILGQSYFWNYWNISKSYWIKNIFQMWPIDISKKVSPRTSLVFMDHSDFWFFSPRTFLVFMENHDFEFFEL